jgi:hypothetical protein
LAFQERKEDGPELDGEESKEEEQEAAFAATLAPLRHKVGHWNLGNQTLKLEGMAKEDPLPYRIECLRVFLSQLLGESELRRLHSEIKAEGVLPTRGLSDTVSKVLGKKRKPLLPLVFQLLAAEQKMFGSPL